MALFGFGKRKPEPLRLIPFASRPPKLFITLLCDGVTAENVPDFASLRALHSRLQAENSEKRVLMTLDDPGQAAYTSGHSIETHRLDDTEGHDLSALGPECFEDGEHVCYLSTPAEFPIRLANLKASAAGVSFDDACGVLYWEGGAVGGPIFPDTVMFEPDAALWRNKSDQIFVQFVPVTRAADALAAFPNGYFHCDLDPLQNYALALHLEERHGMALFGVGASYLAFRRDDALGGDEAEALARDLVKLYMEAPEDAVARLRNALTGKDWLLLRYTES